MTDRPFDAPARVREIFDLPPLARLIDRLRTKAAGSRPFVLETGLAVGASARWHILGAYPVGEARVEGGEWCTSVGSTVCRGTTDPWDALAAWWRAWGNVATQGAWEVSPGAGTSMGAASMGAASVGAASMDPTSMNLEFWGGAVGYLGYELGTRLEAIPVREESEIATPDLHLHLYDEVLLLDRDSERAYFVHRGRAQQREREWWVGAVEGEGLTPGDAAQAALGVEEVSLAESEYLRLVSEVRERIADGEVYEMNLCRRHALRGAPSAWELHRRLRAWQPVPYGALLPWDPVAVISASPECFLRRRGAEVLTRPIKGTAARSHDPAENRARAQALLASDKQRAELAMIIDLERNDLGRVCTPGSVEVVEEAVVEEYSTVLHTVATVRGRLGADHDPWPLLRATFPGGSITGAPKIAAMKVIRQLEPVARKVYTGAIGWLAPNGDLDLSIAIRTLFQHDGTTYYSVGSAITWDSDPVDELRELEAKGAAIRAALLGQPRVE